MGHKEFYPMNTYSKKIIIRKELKTKGNSNIKILFFNYEI